VAHRTVHLRSHFLRIELFAGFLAHQQIGQLLVARQAADMGGQNAVPAEDHARWLLLADIAAFGVTLHNTDRPGRKHNDHR
jgi:hypothetical protein